MIGIAETLDLDAAYVQTLCQGFVYEADLDPNMVMESACCLDVGFNILPVEIDI